MAQTLILLQEKGLTRRGRTRTRESQSLTPSIHESLAVVKDLEGRMKANKELRYHVAAYASTKSVAQQLKSCQTTRSL